MTTEATLTALITPRLKKFHKALAASVPSRGADGDAVGAGGVPKRVENPNSIFR